MFPGRLSFLNPFLMYCKFLSSMALGEELRLERRALRHGSYPGTIKQN